MSQQLSKLAATADVVPQPPPPLRIGMLGAGTVGGGVYEILMGKTPQNDETTTAMSSGGDHHHHHVATGSRRAVITKICVQSLAKTRDFTIHTDLTTLTTDWKELLTDDIDCVVEVAGGCGVAKECLLAALRMRKLVVTANKAVLFEYRAEIAAACCTSNNTAAAAARIGYEAAVCGGIPIVNALTTAWAGDAIYTVQGICNGTTNFMLSHMQDDASVSYEAVLAQAQALGYAEQDPTADVDGHDVRAKMAILAQLAYGTSPTSSQVPCTGIRNVTAVDFAICRSSLQGSTIKLIGTATTTATTTTTDASAAKTLCVTVTPTVVPASHPLAAVTGCGNAVSVQSAHIEQGITMTGPGAGRYPTAQSICADVYRAASGTLLPVAFPMPRAYQTTHWSIVSDYTSRFYIRHTLETTAVTSSSSSSQQEAALAMWSQALPVDRVIYDQDGTLAIVTTPCLYSLVESTCRTVTGNTLVMPILQ
jgi:homoserine dehydrogenase